MTEELDNAVGSIKKSLENASMFLLYPFFLLPIILIQTEIWKNTVMVFTADNGADPQCGGSNCPFRGNHIQVPTIFSFNLRR